MHDHAHHSRPQDEPTGPLHPSDAAGLPPSDSRASERRTETFLEGWGAVEMYLATIGFRRTDRTLRTLAKAKVDPLPVHRLRRSVIARQRELDAWLDRQIEAACGPSPEGATQL